MPLTSFPPPLDQNTKTPVQIWRRIAGALLLGWLTGCAQTPTETTSGAHIRFYSINSISQLSEFKSFAELFGAIRKEMFQRVREGVHLAKEVAKKSKGETA